LPVNESIGTMVVDIGGGTTDIAIISMAGIVTWKSLPVAGDEMNRNIVQYAREHFNLMVGDRVAEEIKIRIGSAMPLEEAMQMEMRGRDLMTGLPREAVVTDAQIREALSRSLRLIIENIKATLEVTPPELVADIYERGIVLVGGGAMLRLIADAISEAAHIPVRIADDPLTCVVRGSGLLLDDKLLLSTIALPSARAN
jgi:rod shape-determining protein MreB